MGFSPSEFNWHLLLIIISISAVVSYVGDMLGMRIGKRRISLFGLRPRYTTTVITLFTGVGVAILTLAVAGYTSESIRMAMFGQRYLERQIASLNKDLNDRQGQLYDMEFDLMGARSDLESMRSSLASASEDLLVAQERLTFMEMSARSLDIERQELGRELSALRTEKIQTENAVALLRAETEQLKKGLFDMKKERVVALQGELLAQTFVEPPADGGTITAGEIDLAMSGLIGAAEKYLSEKSSGTDGSFAYTKPLKPINVILTDEVRRAVAFEVMASKGRRALRLTALSNAVEGQAVEGLVSVFDSRRVFAKDEILMSETLTGEFGQDNTADVLYTLLKRINGRAVALGVMPDPLTGNVGNLGSVDFFEAVERIDDTDTQKTVRLMAATDIYTEGPVNIRIEIGE
ncbi:MAG: DUF3084 domain-containing protein [Synergistaceae bacterium]|jgi:uncharacterized protein (DUF3084 family)|nr:DUF3084 domain-containing protein [Synergistaceae bacterium]